MAKKRKRKGYSDRQKFAVLREEMRRLTQGEKKGDEFSAIMVVLASSMAVLLASVITVTGVRALLTAVTNEKVNPFGPLTYTNTEIQEPQTTFTATLNANNEITVHKSATVRNLSGIDKKPVFIRLSLNYSIYDDEGVNVTSLYAKPINAGEVTTETIADIFTVSYNTTDWEMHANPDGMKYYYYKYIVDPGDSTSEFFAAGSNVTVKMKDDTLPEGYTVEVDVVADTVQAVAHDRFNWTKDDYTYEEVNKVWTTAATGTQVSAIDEDTKAVTWVTPTP